MKQGILLLLAATALGSAGCATTYTSVRKVDDNNYVLTRTTHSPFHTFGSVYNCTPDGDKLKCTELGSL